MLNGSAPDPVPLLAPTIETMSVQGTDLIINGQFGSTPGTVKVGGTTVTADWTSTRITAHLPGPGAPGFAGDVVVSVHNADSNVVQLTLWPVKLHISDQQQIFGTTSAQDPNTPGQTNFTALSGSKSVQTDLMVYLRCDVHDPRSKPGQTPPDLTPASNRGQDRSLLRAASPDKRRRISPSSRHRGATSLRGAGFPAWRAL